MFRLRCVKKRIDFNSSPCRAHSTNQLHTEMNQTTKASTTDTSTHSVDFDALPLKLTKVGKYFHEHPDYKEARDRLLHTLQINDCREIITAIVDGDSLANAFVKAGHRGHIDLLESFLNHGMNMDIKNLNGWTALMLASYNGHEECVRFLLDHNASVDIQNKDGGTVLMEASMDSNTKIIEMLLDKNANPDLQNRFGMTALMRASARGYKEIVQVLLSHGADVELKNDKEKTAFDLARNEEIKEMIRNHVPSSYVLK